MDARQVAVAVLSVYAVASLVAFALFLADKRRARAGARRVRERTLHAVAAAGGWPGALVARRVLRHKNRKPAFGAVLWGIALVHVAAWVWALAR
jgi:uncharacterized membrane protein YsdA (DUF1294 family)